MSYLRPVDPTNGRISTYWAHCHRTTPSSEAGVDYYCPIGTPIRAASDGIIYDVAGGIIPATGRYVTLDLYDGRRVRYLHLSRWNVKKNDRVRAGQIIGYSGASGYGSEFFGASSIDRIPSNTGGPHVHATLWPRHQYQFGRYPIEPTLDFELYVGSGSTAGGGSSPFPIPEKEEDDMADNLTIYRKGGDLRAVGFDRDFRIGGALTASTGVDGAETLAVLVAAGAEVIDLDQRQWDVLMVTLDVTQAKPPAAAINVDALAAALIARLPAATTNAPATPDDVRAAVAAALGDLILAPVKI